MNLTAILYAALALGGLGVVFGLALSFADKQFAVQVDGRIERVCAVLPGVNCGACGYPGCEAFAQAMVRGEAEMTGCKPGGSATAEAITVIMGVAAK